MFKRLFSSIIFMSALLSGCATIVGEPDQLLPIASTPNGASISIIDERGLEVFKGETPTTVTLAKSDGSYWGGKSYKIIISKQGFSSYELPVKASANGWYIGGNLIFGGIIGYFIVDPLNGNMYTLSSKEVNARLTANSAAISKDDQSLSIVLLDDVPDSARARMVKVN
tara:strand:- start:1993 stop:2499 length:507 start_codon:yes stop_codon:yes gene_type:complete